MRLIYRSGLYIDFYGILVLKEVFLERESFWYVKLDQNMITLSFYQEILNVFSKHFPAVVVDTVKFCLMKYPFYLWVNVFCLPLLVGHSSGVPPKRKKGFEENESAHPAGTVHEM